MNKETFKCLNTIIVLNITNLQSKIYIDVKYYLCSRNHKRWLIILSVRYTLKKEK